MKVTILGSEGQIGAYLSEYLTKKGHEVTGIDVVYGPENDLRVTPNSYVESKIKDADFVFFLAFDVGGSRYLKKYQHTFDFVNNNTRVMANTFRLLKRYNKRFVFASSQMSNMSYSPYGVMKRVGELHTTALKGLTVKFWNVYGIEKDMEKAHVITDFIRRGFEEGEFEMLTDGTEQRQFNATSIAEIAAIIQGQFNLIDRFDVKIKPGLAKDSVQMDKRNEADTYITGWWTPKTGIDQGIAKVFAEMKKDYT